MVHIEPLCPEMGSPWSDGRGSETSFKPLVEWECFWLVWLESHIQREWPQPYTGNGHPLFPVSGDLVTPPLFRGPWALSRLILVSQAPRNSFGVEGKFNRDEYQSWVLVPKTRNPSSAEKLTVNMGVQEEYFPLCWALKGNHLCPVRSQGATQNQRSASETPL